jgi:hypothetical protein
MFYKPLFFSKKTTSPINASDVSTKITLLKKVILVLHLFLRVTKKY